MFLLSIDSHVLSRAVAYLSLVLSPITIDHHFCNPVGCLRASCYFPDSSEQEGSA
jgi:hypothetical protein